MVPWPMKQKRYPSDVTDDEWELLVTYLTLMTEDAPQRLHSLREVFNGLRWIIKTGAPWRYRPSDLPPWHVVYQQSRGWIKAGIFEQIVTDLRALLRVIEDPTVNPSAVILDSRTIQSTPESGGRAGYDGAKRRTGTKVHLAVDTLAHLFALKATAAKEQDRAQVAELTEQIQGTTAESAEHAIADQGNSA